MKGFFLVFQFQNGVSFLMEFRNLGNANEHIMDKKFGGLRTDHLPDQSAPFRRAPTRRWGAADCQRVRRLIAGLAADTSYG